MILTAADLRHLYRPPAGLAEMLKWRFDRMRTCLHCCRWRRMVGTLCAECKRRCQIAYPAPDAEPREAKFRVVRLVNGFEIGGAG